MVFDKAAKEIVSNSINTAVCIDNDFEEPYFHAENPLIPSFKIPKELYESFKKENCILDFHKYTCSENWNLKKKNILKNKDLLLLDWQLTTGEPPFKDTLEILLEAVRTESLPFIYIYTEKTDLDEIALHIHSYFSGISKEDLKKKYDLLIIEFEDFIDGEDAEELFNGMKDKFKEVVLWPDKTKEIKKEIFGYIKNKLKLGDEKVGEIYSKLHEIGGRILECREEEVITRLGLHLNNGCFRIKPISDIDIRAIEGEKFVYLINNTLVKISSKKITGEGTASGLISADQVYSDFSKTICKGPKNFLALLGLEMRNLYRDRCSIIGKDIHEINELAFFHHQKSLDLDGDGAFYEFLSNIWKDEVSSFLLDQKPILFSVLNDYKEKNGIDKKLDIFLKNSEDVIQNLAKLNYYYTILRIAHDKPRKIRFGDIFYLENTNEKLSCLFDWQEIPGSDSDKIINYLRQNYSLSWVKTENIKRIDNDNITISNGKITILLKMNDDNNKLILTIDNSRTNEFIVKTENGKLNIYRSNIDFSFLLCITPHCDCLRPKKINNCFYFVGGKEIKHADGLKIGDTGFVSYIKTKKGFVCIEWEIIPFSIYISNKNNISIPIECYLMGEKVNLKHITWQKENYTQRIANESFSHASRVGIDLAGLKKMERNKNNLGDMRD